MSCRPTDPLQRLDQLFSEYQQPGAPGAVVMLIRNGNPFLTKCYGYAELETRRPITAQTRFRLASITKQFTAMSISLLVKDGKLSYDTSLGEIFPEFPSYGRKITIDEILHHTSGLIDYESLIPDTATVQVLDDDVLNMMMAVDSTYFPPGSSYRYSNSGYAVLARVVEELSGLTFPRYLQQRMFEPLGMDGAVAFVDGVNSVADRAYGYSVYPDSIVFTDQSITSAVLGDGGIYASAENLLQWDSTLYHNELLPPAMMEKTFTPHLENYGLGFRIDQFRDTRRVHHTGSTKGFRNVYQRFPDKQFSIIVLTNRNSPESLTPLAEKIAGIFWEIDSLQ